MIVLAFDQPHATLIVTGQQTVATYDTGDGPLSAPPLLGLAGRTVAIASFGNWIVTSPIIGGAPKYPHGAIVGSARVRAVVPVYGITDGFNDGWKQWTWPNFQVNQDRTLLALVSGYEQMPAPLYDDQLPFADFTPGRWAVILTDASTTVWLRGDHEYLEYDAGKAPIPYEVTGPIGEVTL